MRIEVTPQMRVHRVLRKCPGFHEPPEAIPEPIVARVNYLTSHSRSYILGWFDKRSSLQPEGHYLLICNDSIIDIEPTQIQVLPYKDLAKVDLPHQKSDPSRFVLEVTKTDGSLLRVRIPYVDQNGALVFTILRFLSNIIGDRHLNPKEHFKLT